MTVAGTYACVTKTPVGEQTGVLTVVPGADGKSWTGTLSGDLGSMDIEDGVIDGETLRWTMDLTVPIPIKLDCEATIDGDQLSGSVRAGVFGSMPLTGRRTG